MHRVKCRPACMPDMMKLRVRFAAAAPAWACLLQCHCVTTAAVGLPAALSGATAVVYPMVLCMNNICTACSACQCVVGCPVLHGAASGHQAHAMCMATLLSCASLVQHDVSDRRAAEPTPAGQAPCEVLDRLLQPHALGACRPQPSQACSSVLI
jgi:hypothetical protein